MLLRGSDKFFYEANDFYELLAFHEMLAWTTISRFFRAMYRIASFL